MPPKLRTPLRLPSPLRTIRAYLQRDYDPFLRDINGLIHVGASIGQEIELYARFDLTVLWVEPIAEIFQELQRNLQGHKKQEACQGLITDRDGVSQEFHISNNLGVSSSIFPFKKHKEMWPEVAMTETRTLTTSTLPTLLEKEQVDISQYQALILDTQGSELQILQGCIPILHNFQVIKVEVADFESYEGSCTLEEIEAFMSTHKYQERYRNAFKKDESVGSYYDITYSRVDT